MQNQQTPWFYKNKCLLAGLILSITAQNALAQNWNLIWSDEFNGSISSDWVFETGNGSGGWGNNELEYYRRENTTVENGMLVITARQENYGGFNYTSSRLKTQGKKSFRYGKIEARISTPSAAGTWPAFWMLGSNINNVGWPACGEIDIMEHVNDSPQIHGTLHWQDNNGNYASYGGNTSADVTGFHVYGIEWDENAIRWLVDGNQYHETNIAGGVNGTGEFHNEFFILLNLAIGGNWPGFNIDNTVFPAQMKVDWVRVYQREDNNGGGGGCGTNDLPKTIEAETFSAMSGVQTETTTDTGGGENVGWIDNGDWLAYNAITIPATGDYTLEYRVASPGGGQLSLDLNAGSIALGNASIPATGGWQNWQTISQTVHIEAGTYNLGIYALTGGWNLNWIRLSSANTTPAFSITQEAEDYSLMQGIQSEATSDDGGGQNVGWVDAGDWLTYPVEIPSNGTYRVEYRVASPAGGTLSLDSDAGGTTYGSVDIPSTGGWQNWETINHTVQLRAGTHTFGIYAVTGGWNLNWWRITRIDG